MPADPADPADPAAALPDFLGIGALKAGTSYLDVMLRSHPGLSLPTHLKEVEFFNHHYERGADWYAGQFAAPDGRPRGEVSPQYLFDAACPARIAAANPAVRLIASVRNPVARTVSQYRHWVQETAYRGDFETFLAEHPGALERSRYWACLQRYRDHFPDDQLRVEVFEDLVGDPLPALQGIYAYLGVDPGHEPAAMDEAVNVSGGARFPRAYAQGKRVSRWLYAHGQSRVVDRMKSLGSGTLLRGGGGGGSSSGPVAAGPSPELAGRLADQLRPDAEQLSQYLGRDLVAFWKL